METSTLHTDYCFTPYVHRDGNIEVTNVYMDYKLGNKLRPLKANYTHWEIRYYRPCPYYQLKEDYLARGYYYTHNDECVSNGSHTMDVSFFDTAELSTTIAYWVPDSSDFSLQLVDDRLFEMSEDEQLKFLKLAKIAHAEIQNQLDSQADRDL